MKRILLAGIATVILSSPAMAANTRIGVTMALFDDNFLTNVREAMAAQAKATPGVEIKFEDAQGDIGRQINQVQNFIAEGVSAIIANPADTSATRTITKMAEGAGIPLVYVNRGPDQKKLPENVAVVVSDHIVAGRLQMQAIADCMGGKGNVAIMLGELASNATAERTAGNKEIIAKFPEIKVVEEQTANYQRSQAINLMTNWIATGTKIDAVVANNDEMAIGALIAMKQAGVDPEKVCVGGVDATADALSRMHAGDLDVTVFQDAKGQGRGAVEAAVKLANKEKQDQIVLVPYELVTKDNVAVYDAK